MNCKLGNRSFRPRLKPYKTHRNDTNVPFWASQEQFVFVENMAFRHETSLTNRCTWREVATATVTVLQKSRGSTKISPARLAFLVFVFRRKRQVEHVQFLLSFSLST